MFLRVHTKFFEIHEEVPNLEIKIFFFYKHNYSTLGNVAVAEKRLAANSVAMSTTAMFFWQ